MCGAVTLSTLLFSTYSTAENTVIHIVSLPYDCFAWVLIPRLIWK